MLNIRIVKSNVCSEKQVVSSIRRNKFTIQIALIFMISALGFEAKSEEKKEISVLELLEFAVENSPSLKIDRGRVDRAHGVVGLGWSYWKPQISASGSVLWQSAQAELNFGEVLVGYGVLEPADIPPGLNEPIDLQPEWSAAGRATIRQLLASPEAFFAPAIAKAQLRADSARFNVARNNLQFATVRMALGLEALSALSEAAQRAIEVSAQRVKDAEVRVSAGVGTSLDVHRAKTALTEAQSNQQGILADRSRLNAQLRALVGWDDGELKLTSIDSLDSLVEKQTTQTIRPEVSQAKQQLKAAHHANQAQSLSWLPTVFVQGQLTYSTIGGFADENVQGTVLLGVEVPLYDGGARYARQRISSAERVQAAAALEAIKRQIQAEIDIAIASKQEAESRLHLAQAQLSTAQEAVKQVERLYNGGLATSLDLQTADTQRFAADRGLAERQLAFVLSDLELVRVQGGTLRFK